MGLSKFWVCAKDFQWKQKGLVLDTDEKQDALFWDKYKRRLEERVIESAVVRFPFFNIFNITYTFLYFILYCTL